MKGKKPDFGRTGRKSEARQTGKKRKRPKYALVSGSLKVPLELEGLKFVKVYLGPKRKPIILYSAFDGFKKEPPLFDPITLKACMTGSIKSGKLAAAYKFKVGQKNCFSFL